MKQKFVILLNTKITNFTNDYFSKTLDYNEEIDEGGLEEIDEGGLEEIDDDGILEVDLIDDSIE